MGLDMYLSASMHLSDYDYMTNGSGEPTEQQLVCRQIAEAAGLGKLRLETGYSTIVETTVAYWRKANHIHNWFVQNVQGGVDNCESFGVSLKQMRELVKLCDEVLAIAQVEPGPVHTSTVYSAEHPFGKKKYETHGVITNPQDVAALLPTQSGFFFGGTDYTEFYLDDTRYTSKRLGEIIAVVEAEMKARDTDWSPFDFRYRASW